MRHRKTNTKEGPSKCSRVRLNPGIRFTAAPWPNTNTTPFRSDRHSLFSLSYFKFQNTSNSQLLTVKCSKIPPNFTLPLPFVVFFVFLISKTKQKGLVVALNFNYTKNSILVIQNHYALVNHFDFFARVYLLLSMAFS